MNIGKMVFRNSLSVFDAWSLLLVLSLAVTYSYWFLLLELILIPVSAWMERAYRFEG